MIAELPKPAGIKVKVSEPFKILYNLPENINTVICIGGRGGMKTYEVSKFVAFQATIKKKRCAIVRDEKVTIRETILNEIFNRYETANENGQLSKYYDKIESGIRDKKTGNMLVFTKGFRASSNEKKSNLKGISDTDIAIIEEADDIREFQKFNTFKDSIRTQNRLIIVILNTPDIQHWIVKRYFNLEQVHDGYWKLLPKNIEGVKVIQTSYKDNEHLPKDVIRDYEAYGDPNSHLYDLHYYYTSILGYASSGRKGQVHRKVKPITLAEYMALPYKEYYGQDFGTASPAGMVGVKIYRNNCWCRQLNYKPLNTLEIAKMYCYLKLSKSDTIIADYADAKAISKLTTGYKRHELSEEEFAKYPQLISGWNIIKCIKGNDSVQYGLSVMDSMNLFAVEESADLWNEILNRVYGTDKSGEYTNDPEPGFDHLMDAWMYVITHFERGKRMGSIAVEW